MYVCMLILSTSHLVYINHVCSYNTVYISRYIHTQKNNMIRTILRRFILWLKSTLSHFVFYLNVIFLANVFPWIMKLHHPSIYKVNVARINLYMYIKKEKKQKDNTT